MGPAFVILFWLIVLGTVIGIWLVSLIIYMIARAKKWRMLKWLAAVPIVAIPLAGMVVGLFLVQGIIRASVPRYVYEDVFHKVPEKDVQELCSSVFWFADTGSIWIQFKCDAGTFRELVPKEMKKVNNADVGEQLGNIMDLPPSWWLPLEGASVETLIFQSDHSDGRSLKGFAYEAEVFRRRHDDGLTQYRFLGID